MKGTAVHSCSATWAGQATMTDVDNLSTNIQGMDQHPYSD